MSSHRGCEISPTNAKCDNHNLVEDLHAQDGQVHSFHISVLVQILITVFRKHAKADDAPKLFKLLGLLNMREAAKKEWEGLVLLEEDD
jgi:hypothetical protein